MSHLPKIAYSIPEAATATGTTERAVRDAIKEGSLRARRQPYANGDPRPDGFGKYLILHDDLMDWIAQMPAAS